MGTFGGRKIEISVAWQTQNDVDAWVREVLAD